MKLTVSETEITGCRFARISGIEDSRGSFAKLFHQDTISKYLPNFTPREMYLTSSTKNVLRGMHFQLPPHDHQKIVICLEGSVVDVILDLRKGETYGKTASIDLSANATNAVFLPKGVAHGFYTQSENASLLYVVDSQYAPDYDKGILWDSFGFEWPSYAPILSGRDTQHPSFGCFKPPKEWQLVKKLV